MNKKDCQSSKLWQSFLLQIVKLTNRQIDKSSNWQIDKSSNQPIVWL